MSESEETKPQMTREEMKNDPAKAIMELQKMLLEQAQQMKTHWCPNEGTGCPNEGTGCPNEEIGI